MAASSGGPTGPEPSRSFPSSRSLRHALVALVAAAVAFATPGLAHAEPDDPFPSKEQVDNAREDAANAAAEVGRVRGQLAAANERLRQLDIAAQTAVEEYNTARYELEQADKAATATRDKARAAAKTAADKRQAIGQFAAASYQHQAGLRELTAFLSAEGPQSLLDQASTVSMVSTSAARDLAGLRASQVVANVLARQAAKARADRSTAAAAADKARDKAVAALATQQSSVAGIEREKTALVARLAQLEGVSTTLARQRQEGLEELARKRAEEARRKAEEARQKAEEERRKREEEKRKQDDEKRRGGGGGDDNGGGNDDDDGDDNGGGGGGGTSQQGRIAVDFARAQLGEPYVFGGAGPRTWDCSGLVLRAWGAAGIYLPHTARGQYRLSQKLSVGELRPGDLIFFANNPGDPGTIYHVAIYLGNGKMIHAPRPGRNVEIKSMYYMGSPSHYARPR